MDAKSRVKAELKALIDEWNNVVNACKSLGAADLDAFGLAYQVWYTKTLKILEALAKDRLDEFKSLYMPDPKRKYVHEQTYVIQDFIRGVRPSQSEFAPPDYDPVLVTIARLFNQAQILASISSRIEGILADVEGYLLSQIEDNQLSAALMLKKISYRAAGALAGVVLETHLLRVATNHSVAIAKRNPTIADLNDPIRNAGIYDVTTWRKVQHLADIRNLCSHQKNREPTEAEVDDLLSGVKSIVANVA